MMRASHHIVFELKCQLIVDFPSTYTRKCDVRAMHKRLHFSKLDRFNHNLHMLKLQPQINANLFEKPSHRIDYALFDIA